MDGGFGDARLEELKLLSEIERAGELAVTPPTGPWRDLVAYLVQERLVNDLNPKPGELSAAPSYGLPGESPLERTLHAGHIETLHRILEGSTTKLRLTHRGRVRLSELKHALRSGREREPFGILWDIRHWDLDVQIAILEASAESPLAIAYLDMNGLKRINDRHGHDAGNLALRTYFESVASAVSDRGQGYRLSGGADEVLLALPNCDETTAIAILRLASSKLMGERLWPMDSDALLSIASGLVMTTDAASSPKQLQSVADDEQKRAKERSRTTMPRPSVIAVRGKGDLIVIEHQRGAPPVKISASYFQDARRQGISFTVTNISKDTVPPFKVGIFHPKLGSYFIFPSEKSGPLLQDQKRDFNCVVLESGLVPAWFPKFRLDKAGGELSAENDAGFEFRLVLEDSDNKILYMNKRIARGFVALIRQTVEHGAGIQGTWHEWQELSNEVPDE